MTHVGQQRQINEDYVYVDNTRRLFIVCDGLGGQAAGEVAAHRAIEFTIEFLDKHWSVVENANQSPVGYFKLTQLVEQAIHHTCRKINCLADGDPFLNGMATTLTLLLLVDGNAIVGHVGDSRLYLKRNGNVFQLTTDHTIMHELMESFEGVDPGQIKKFANCLTRTVGNNSSVAVETLMFEARQHDVMLLCSDGLSNYFNEPARLAEMLSGDHVNQIAESLVQFANQSGGHDNITAVVIRIVDVDDFKLNGHRIRLDCENVDRPVSGREATLNQQQPSSNHCGKVSANQ